MPDIANPVVLGFGLALVLVGWLAWRWSARNAIDLEGAAIGAAWQGARSGRIPDVPSDIRRRYDEVAGETSHVGRARKVGTIAIRHVIARFVGIAGIVAILAGLVLVAAGLFWR